MFCLYMYLIEIVSWIIIIKKKKNFKKKKKKKKNNHNGYLNGAVIFLEKLEYVCTDGMY